jgi:Uma2 family endonuclease
MSAGKVSTRKTVKAGRNGKIGEPTWDIALLFPRQGDWSEEEYFALETNRLVELSDGRLEFPSMPGTLHQWIALYLYELLKAFAYPKLGLVLAAPLPVRLWPLKIREPDVVFMFREHRERVQEKVWEGADLAMEVVSSSAEDRRRDLIQKRAEYARAGISEYWIVDPKKHQITVLWLRGKRYIVHGKFKKGQAATSRLLEGFAVDVDAALAGPEL